jgi:hypothetical protein
MKRIGSLTVLHVLFSSLAFGDTYTFTPTSWGDYGTVGNWKIGSAAATTLPGIADSLVGNQTFFFDLGGNTYDIGGWITTDVFKHMHLTNGVLRFNGSVSLYTGEIHIRDGATLSLGATATLTSLNQYQRKITVYSGGVLDIQGAELKLGQVSVTIDAGGRADFAHRKISKPVANPFSLINSGDLVLTNGLSLDSGVSSSVNITQKAGTLTLGGDISKNDTAALMYVTLSNGTVTVTKDVAFHVTSASFPAGAAVTFVIADGKRFDMTPFDFGAGVALAQTGPGILRLGPTLPSTLDMQSGMLECCVANQTYDFSGVTMAVDTKIMLRTSGIVFSGTPQGTGYTFGLDADAIPIGIAFATTADPVLLAKIKADVEADLPSDLEVLQTGNSLLLVTPFRFDSTSVSDWNDPAGWACGYVPTNQHVIVAGNGVTARISASIPACQSIAVIDRATVSIETDCALPPVALGFAGQLIVTHDAALHLTNGFTCAAAQFADLPSLTVEAGAELYVPANMKFGNVGVNLFGRIETTGVGTLTFGFAAPSETALFAMRGEDGTIAMKDTGTYNVSLLQVACPASGGTVVIAEPIVWRNMTLPAISGQALHGFQCGVNNPTNQPFTLVLDNTLLRRGTSSQIKGAATLCLTNNAVFDCLESDNMQHRIDIANRGRIIVHEGATLWHLITNAGYSPMTLNPDEPDFPALALCGGTARIFDTSGNGKSVFSTDGVFEIYRENNANAVSHPFAGFAKAEIPEGKTLTLRSVEMGVKLDKSIALADVPITGAGSVLATNATPRGFALTVINGSNSATGVFSACQNTRVYFNDAANWAGTVQAEGNIALTNMTEDAVYAAAAFGQLDLRGEFPLRVGADGNDRLILGAGGFTGTGKLVVTGVDGYDFKAAHKPVLIASVLKTAAQLPACDANGWGLRLRYDPDDATRMNVWVSQTGLVIRLQ